MRNCLRNLILFGLMAFASPVYASFEIEGFLSDSEGNPLSGNYSLWVEIKATNDPDCLLYREKFSNVQVDSSGSFVVSVGSGTPTLSVFEVAVESVLKNQVEQKCYNENGALIKFFTPGANATRSLSVEFEVSAGQFIDAGTMVLSAVPYAVYAQHLEQHSVKSLLRVEDSGQPQEVSALTSSNFTELMELIGGTSSKYLKHSAAEGAVLPGVFGQPSLLMAGSIWFDLQVGELKYYDGSTVKTIGSESGGGSGTVTSIAAGTGLTTGGSPITTSGTISIADLGVDTNQLANGAVTSDKLADEAVTTGKLVHEAVTESKIAPNAVTTTKIGDSQVTDAKISSVSDTKLTGTIKVESGKVGIGTTSPTAKLDVSGDIKATGSVTAVSFYGGEFNYSSDRRLKTDIRPIEHPLDKVLHLAGVNFKWKKSGQEDIGFIAQDVESVLPEVVKNGKDDDLGEIKTVRYGNITALLIEAVKEFWAEFKKSNLEKDAEISHLRNRLNEKDAETRELLKRLNSLEERLQALEKNACAQ